MKPVDQEFTHQPEIGQPVALPAGMSEPYGYWHQGKTDDESDFHLHADSGDVSCESCTKLYSAAQVQAMLAAHVPVAAFDRLQSLADSQAAQLLAFDDALEPPVAQPSPAAVERKPLTDEQAILIWPQAQDDWNALADGYNQWDFLGRDEMSILITRQVEAAHGIKAQQGGQHGAE